MRRLYWILSYTILLALLVWIIGAAIGSLFYRDRSFLELLITGVPIYSIYVRILALVFLLSSSLFIYRAIVRRRQVEQALRESEREKAIILDSLSEHVLYHDTTVTILWANRAAAASVGLSPADLVGRHCYEIWHQGSAPCPGCPVIRALRTGQPQQSEIVSPDGRIWFIRGYPVRNKQGGVTGAVEITLDITERKRVEAALERHTAQLEALHQVGLELTAELELDALLRSIVVRAVQLLEAKAGGLYLYRPDLDSLEWVVAVGSGMPPTGRTLPRGEGVAGRVWDTGQPIIVDDYRHWEGRAAQYNDFPCTAIVGVPIRWGGKFLGVLDILTDPPDHFCAEDVALLEQFVPLAAAALENARLLEAERRRNAELEALREASLCLTSRLELQPLLQTILEYTLKLVHADDAHIFLYDGQKATFGAALWADGRETAYNVPRPAGLTYTVARSGERLVIPDVNSHPLYQDWPWSGAIAGFPLRIGERILGVMNVALARPHLFDGSELRVLDLLADQAAIALENARLYGDLQQQMDRLKQTQAQLVQAARMAAVGELAAGIAHELNNPLTSILGFAELLLEDSAPDSPYKKDVQKIATHAQRARGIIRNLLNFTRQTRPEKQSADVNVLLQQAHDLVREQLKVNGITVEESYAADLESLWVDQGQMKQVFLNLIQNAVQAMPEGGTLRLHTARMGQGVAISISDTGGGIPPEVQEHLFEPFFSTRPNAPGLGLSTCLGIVKEHGGRITVDSQVSTGSTFTIWLPAKGVIVPNTSSAHE